MDECLQSQPIISPGTQRAQKPEKKKNEKLKNNLKVGWFVCGKSRRGGGTVVGNLAVRGKPGKKRALGYVGGSSDVLDDSFKPR